MDDNYLYRTLTEYGNTDIYPFHMPGHKRQGVFENPFRIDITEIDGFDNLHHAEDILKEAQERAANLYDSAETHFLVNGSTAGILSAISACVPRRGKLLMARNCHKAAYHGVLLNELEVVYVYPEAEQEYGMNGRIDPQVIANELAGQGDIAAVLLTSPTYDGIVSDIQEIVRVAHQYGVPLIVDEAHGAHFGFHPYFPESSVHMGVDIVIHSLHKTLPAFTQTALLHVNGDLVNRERLRMYLGIYQTSSPSYVLMAGIDQCVCMIRQDGEMLFEAFAKRLEAFYEEAKQWQHIRLFDGGKDFDRSKLILSVKYTDMNGLHLQQRLRREHRLELEMAAGTYALALTSMMDTTDGFARLMTAVTKIDDALKPTQGAGQSEMLQDTVNPNPCTCRISEALDCMTKTCKLEECVGETAAEFLYLYPPGIPLLVPGEVMSPEMLGKILAFKEQGYSLQGPDDFRIREMKVLR